jgi:aspartyl/asparaginyl beta-hydroxylase (cupin superfamily)
MGSFYSEKRSTTTAKCEQSCSNTFRYLADSLIIHPLHTRCPKTAALVAKIPNVINAGFSCLEPGSTTGEHQDYNKVRQEMRYLFPLCLVWHPVSHL